MWHDSDNQDVEGTKNRSLKPVKFYFGRTTAFDRLDLLERRPILGESENG